MSAEIPQQKSFEDTLLGVLFDSQRSPFVVFLRTSVGLFKFFHLLLQNTGGEVFIIQETKLTPDEKFIVNLQDQDGEMIRLLPKGIRELDEGSVVRALAAGTARTKAFRRDVLAPAYWIPLEKAALYDFIDRLAKHGRNMAC